jgi:hypothetical protein
MSYVFVIIERNNDELRPEFNVIDVELIPTSRKSPLIHYKDLLMVDLCYRDYVGTVCVCVQPVVHIITTVA